MEAPPGSRRAGRRFHVRAEIAIYRAARCIPQGMTELARPGPVLPPPLA